MKRADKLKPAADVAGSRERAAARDVGTSQQNLAELERKLAELTGYREEYARRLRESHEALDAAQLADFRAFLTRLNEAIAYQDGRIRDARRQHARFISQWTRSRQKVDALGKVMTRFMTEDRHHVERGEQKEQDERSQRRKPAIDDDRSNG
jgi:flagellar protein FliJ